MDKIKKARLERAEKKSARTYGDMYGYSIAALMARNNAYLPPGKRSTFGASISPIKSSVRRQLPNVLCG